MAEKGDNQSDDLSSNENTEENSATETAEDKNSRKKLIKINFSKLNPNSNNNSNSNKMKKEVNRSKNGNKKRATVFGFKLCTRSDSFNETSDCSNVSRNNEIEVNNESYCNNNGNENRSDVCEKKPKEKSDESPDTSSENVTQNENIASSVSSIASTSGLNQNSLRNLYPGVYRWLEFFEVLPLPSTPETNQNPSTTPSTSRIHPTATIVNKQYLSPKIHTQIDYIHCLVPDLYKISNCSYYWGKIDRYEAERLLDKKNEGTFLLRDSAQEDHLFSVSFRRFDRSLHARIEQWNHRFSFDSHDPGVFSSTTVSGLIEHYKDPSHCMFFEPMLTMPLNRVFCFSLKHLCRAIICSQINYDSIDSLDLPKSLKNYLREYHYKQQVRVRSLDVDSF